MSKEFTKIIIMICAMACMITSLTEFWHGRTLEAIYFIALAHALENHSFNRKK